MAIYTIISLIGLALIVYGYGAARASDANVSFYTAPAWANHLLALLMVPALIFAVASSTPLGNIKKKVKNPLLIGTKIWAIGHLLINGDLASWVLFGAFLAWAVIVMINTNRRGLEITGEASTKNDVITVVVGLVIWGALAFWLHGTLFGVPVIA